MSTIKFYCMTLDSRKDRQDKIKMEFKRLDIPIQWWIVKRHPEDGNYGCFESHVNVWDKNDADIAVIFEDDFEFKGQKKEFWNILNEAFGLSNKYDIIHLGNIAYRIDQQVSPNFYSGKFLTACCYVSRREKLKNLIPIAQRYYGSQIDVVLSHIASQVGLLPCKVFQDFTDSNNAWTQHVPIVSKFPSIESNIRINMTQDPYYLLKYHHILTDCAIKFMVGLNSFQQLLPKLLYYTGVEFVDRRF